MTTITEQQRDQVISLLRTSGITREDIADSVGVSPGTVTAIKSYITMGAYRDPAAPASDPDTEELIDASETTFGLERDLQAALRANIDQLESGLTVIYDGKERRTDAGKDRHNGKRLAQRGRCN